MLYPVESALVWSKRFKIMTSPIPCPGCGNDLELDVPIATADYRGLEASPCPGCGLNSRVFRAVPVSTTKLELWESLRPI